MRRDATTRQLVLVDGRSGAGKSEWVTQSEEYAGFVVVSLDDLYPGWDGLDAGHIRAYEQVVLPWSRGERARVATWDWGQRSFGGVFEIDPEASVVIEGCGALSILTAPYATYRYWIEADIEVRKRRALERDGELFAPHWTRWALQEDRFYSTHRSWELADSVVRT